jgi:O-methyltransferase
MLSKLKRRKPPQPLVAPPDFDDEKRATFEAVRPFTMTSPERVGATCDAVRYIARYGIEGAVVECGVWAGGMMMAAARTLLEVDDSSRDLYLFDTFAGMTEPTDADVTRTGAPAAETYEASWTPVDPDGVRANVLVTGYPEAHVHLVVGDVLETVPAHAPERIALLRLDTDWYESTRHELEHLVSRVSPGGVLIVDDYGHWPGARRAVDEFLETYPKPVFLARTDFTGRLAVLG